MKKKLILLLTIIFGISLLTSGIVMIFTKIYKDNRQKGIKQELEVIQIIDKEYEKFNTKASAFSNKRDTILESLKSYGSYYAEVSENYDKIILTLESYEDMVLEIDKDNKLLKSKCIEKEYNKYDTNNKCKIFLSNYEQVINSFISDVKVINNIIVEYNDWVKKEENKKYSVVDLYKMKTYKEFIDINKDKIYEGQIGD